MSHPIPQEVEEKLEQLILDIAECLDTGTDGSGYLDTVKVREHVLPALLSVYNSGEEVKIKTISSEVLMQELIDRGYTKIELLSAPSSEDNA